MGMYQFRNFYCYYEYTMTQEVPCGSLELPLLDPKQHIESWCISCLVGFKNYDKERMLTHLINQLPDSDNVIIFTANHNDNWSGLSPNTRHFKIEELSTVWNMCRLTYKTPKVIIFDHNVEQIDPQLLRMMFYNGRFYRLSIFFLMEEIQLRPELRQNTDNFFLFNPYKSNEEIDQQHGNYLIQRYDQYFMDTIRSMWLMATQQSDNCLVISMDVAVEPKYYWYRVPN